MHSKWDRIISALVTWIKNISRVSEAKRGRYELIQVSCAEIIFSYFESIWWHFSHTFHYFTDKISGKYDKKNVKVEHGCWSLSFACVLRSYHIGLLHHVSYVCEPYSFQHRWRSWVLLSFSHMWGNEVVITHMIRVRCVLRGPLYHMNFQSKSVRNLTNAFWFIQLTYARILCDLLNSDMCNRICMVSWLCYIIICHKHLIYDKYLDILDTFMCLIYVQMCTNVLFVCFT